MDHGKNQPSMNAPTDAFFDNPENSKSPSEIDSDTQAELAAWELLRDARAELETLRDAVRNFRDVEGSFPTQLAAERLIALLPDNA